MSGISARHGAHHEAHTFTHTGRPAKSESFTGRPSTSVKAKSGAACPNPKGDVAPPGGTVITTGGLASSTPDALYARQPAHPTTASSLRPRQRQLAGDAPAGD